VVAADIVAADISDAGQLLYGWLSSCLVGWPSSCLVGWLSSRLPLDSLDDVRRLSMGAGVDG